MTNENPASIVRAAHILGVSVQFLRQEAEAGNIPALRDGKALLFNIDAVRAALAEMAAQPTQKPPTPRKGIVGGKQ